MNLHGKDIKIFSGSANPELARQIAEQLDLPLGNFIGRADDPT